MKSKDIHAMPVAELREKLAELRTELMKLNAQVATGTTPKSPGQLRTTKRTIAQLLTELKTKEGSANKA